MTAAESVDITRELARGKFTDEMLNDMRARIGLELRTDACVNNEDATRLAILRFCEGIGLEPRGAELLLDSVTDTVDRICGSLDAPRRLRDVGVPYDALPGIATLGMADWFLRGNPRPVRGASELQQILEEAW